jgi:hypothetical protein
MGVNIHVSVHKYAESPRSGETGMILGDECCKGPRLFDCMLPHEESSMGRRE